VQLLDRSAIFYLRVGRTRAEACLLAELHCRIARGKETCWSPCEIKAASRMLKSVCAIHGELLAEWMPLLSSVHSKWSAEKARQLGGKSDFDGEACTAWLAEMRPYLKEAYGEAGLADLYKDSTKRTRLWLMARRGLACCSEDFYGDEGALTSTELKKALDVELTAANTKELKVQVEKMYPPCSVKAVEVRPAETPKVEAQPRILIEPPPAAPIIVNPGCCGQQFIPRR
jgi:hypothetical protein